MSMSLIVLGFRPPDADYAKKVAAWRACIAAGIQPPAELMRMFDGNEPQDAGQEVDIKGAIRAYRADMRDGYDVEIAKLPPGVKVVRFYASF